MLRSVFVVATASLLAASPAFAITAFLRGNGDVQGLYRYCSYSNGETYTVNAVELCPMSVETGLSYCVQVPGFLAVE